MPEDFQILLFEKSQGMSFCPSIRGAGEGSTTTSISSTETSVSSSLSSEESEELIKSGTNETATGVETMGGVVKTTGEEIKHQQDGGAWICCEYYH